MIVYSLYGHAKSKAVYMSAKKPGSPKICNKRYPRPFYDTITIKDNRYLTYRRRRVVDGVEVK